MTASDQPSLARILWQQAQHRPRATAYCQVGANLDVERTIDFASMAADARTIALLLAARVPPGSRILLAYANGLEAIRAFWGCIAAGMIAIPAPPPESRQSKVGRARLTGIGESAGVALALTTDDGLEDARRNAPSLPWLSLDTLADGRAGANEGALPAAESGSLAYLQYTSGSTTEPRGVCVTHDNVRAQCRALLEAFPLDPEQSRSLTWLPWFHDYGLIHALIQPAFAGIPSFIMSTPSFLRDPLRWLKAVSRHRISHTGAPNFAYQACVQALERNPDWSADLSCLQTASCGAEPIRSETLSGFAERFAPFGFSGQALTPSYGLAESVLGVTAFTGGVKTLACDRRALEHNEVREPEVGSSAPQVLVSCGRPLPGTALRIVDPATTQALPEGRVGEIWVCGPSVAAGYWEDPRATAEVFGWRLADGTAGSHLRTGDLGFLQNGELYVTGRRKDLLLINGRNLYPQDLEISAAGADPGIRQGGTLAARVDRDGQDCVVMLVECLGRPDPDTARRIGDAVLREVTADHAVDVEEVVLLRSGSLPRTSSGKPQRARAADLYDAGAFEDRRFIAAAPPLAQDTGRDALLQTLGDIWAAVLDGEAPQPDDNFFELGGDSLLATQVVSRVRATLGLEISISAMFEAPTLAALADHLRAASPAAAGLDSHGADDPPPALSFSQERMWFMHQLAPDSAAYNVPLAIRLHGPLDEGSLVRAFDLVVRRHAVLRTRFEAHGQAISTVIDPEEASPGLRCTDLSSLSDEALDAAVRHMRVTAGQPFELHRGPLLRAELLRLGARDHVLLMVMHHIVGDQWSCAVIGRELAQCYNAVSRGETPELAAFGMQYEQYAARHRRWFDTARSVIELDYWRSRLAGLQPLRLNEDFRRPAQQGYHGAAVSVPLPGSLLEGLSSLAGSRHASLSMVLIAALDALLYRHTGRADVALGVPIANRHHLASEGLVGTFVNTLVFRTEVAPDLPFLDLLERVRETALGAFEHQDMPFEMLVRELDLPHDASQSPLFNVMFNMINTPVKDVEFSGLTWERLDIERGASQFDLTVSVDAGLNRTVQFEYSTDLFTAATMERFAAQYLRILERIVATPSVSVAALPVVDGSELALLEEWGTGDALALDESTSRITDLTAFGADAGPDRPAVIFGDSQMSHAELAQRSNRLARLLRERGIARGSVVAVCMQRSPGLLVALLGTLKAGAAYVPLDPAYPRERLRFQARDANTALLLADAAGLAALDWPIEQTVRLDAGDAALARLAGSPLAPDPDRDARPRDPAYVIYTSGSTGVPKGVVVPHVAVINFLTSMARQPGLQAHDTLLAVTTVSFDIAVLELLLPLTVGACTVLAGDDASANGERLAALIDRHAVTVMQATPSRWDLLLQAGWPAAGLHKVLVGGESLSPDLAARLTATGAEVWNMYGPTETAVWSTVWRVQPRQHPAISLGEPIANTVIEVVDERGSLCPIGVPGEIRIGGAGVATGYLNFPELTSERFVGQAGQRRYATGDLARWCHDGALEHLGRMDSQVKLRGYRVELGEIQARLETHADVRRAVVAVKRDARGMDRLVAYLLADAVDIDSLRSHLRAFLPEHMVPAHYMTVPTFPELPNGKIDRRALPAPDLSLQPVDRDAGPRSLLERQLLTIWQEFLAVGEFGIHSNFFDLGGHSMLGLELVRQIERQLGIRCPVATLFQAPTVADMAATLTAAESDPSAAVIVTTECPGPGPTLFCLAGTHAYAGLASYLDGRYRVLGLMSRAEVDQLELADAPHLPSLEALAAVYCDAIVSLQPCGPYLLAGFSIGGVLAFEVARRLRARGAQVNQVVMIDCSLPGFGPRHVYRWVQKRALDFLRRRPLGYLKHAVSRLRARQPFTTGTAAGDPIRRNAARRNGEYARLIRQYRPQDPYPDSVLFIQSADDPIRLPAYGWCDLAPALELHRLPGAHMELLETPAVRQVAGAIRAGLSGASARDGLDGSAVPASTASA